MRNTKVWVRKSAAVLLSCTMMAAVVPTNTVLAADLNNEQQVQETTEIAASSDYQATKEKLAALGKTLTSFYGETSVQYVIMDGGEITVSGSAGYANKEMKLAPEASTMYGIGSVSKIYTTVAILQLVDKGLIELDEPVVTYIPEFTMADDRYKEITVRMLLNHTSGLLGSTLNNAILYGDVDQTTTDNLLESLSKQRLKSDPGTIAVYCNDGFSLAELVVEHVTGISFTSYLHQNIISPLGMEDTNTAAERFVSRKMARIYSTTGERLPYETLTAIGAGGIYSTAEDMCKFSRIFMEDSNGLLSSESLEMMSNSEYLNGIWQEDKDEVLSFGLGWDNVRLESFENYGIVALEKGGDTKNYHADLIVLPQENVSISILSVGGASSYNKIAAEEVLLTYLEEKGRIERNSEEEPLMDTSLPAENMPKEYKEYSGYYANISTVCQVEIKDNVMTFNNLSYNNPVELTYYRDGWFEFGNDSVYIRIVKEENGVVYLYAKEASSLPSIGTINSGMYFAQKLEDYEVSQEAIDAWLNRAGNEYLIISEKYSSYCYGLDMAKVILPGEDTLILDKYLWMLKVVDDKNLTIDLQIPMTLGRDLADYKIVSENNTEYLKVNDYVYILKDDIKKLPSSDETTITIDESGYGKYYEIPELLDGKILKIDVPEHASFVVYNAAGSLVCNSYLDKTKKVTVEKGGYVLFLGDADAEFTVNVK